MPSFPGSPLIKICLRACYWPFSSFVPLQQTFETSNPMFSTTAVLYIALSLASKQATTRPPSSRCSFARRTMSFKIARCLPFSMGNKIIHISNVLLLIIYFLASCIFECDSVTFVSRPPRGPSFQLGVLFQGKRNLLGPSSATSINWLGARVGGSIDTCV